MTEAQAQGGQISLSKLSDAWQRFGCAICSHVPSPFAVEGARIELHHILPRSQGGTDEPDNLMGLCGELCPEKCHWRVTNEIIKIRWAENVDCWVALDDHGIHHLCRKLSVELLEEAGMSDSLVLSKDTLRRHHTSQLPEQRLPEGIATAHGRQGAETRFMAARDLHQTVERGWLRLALVLQYAMAHGDHIQLGFRTIGEWADAIGISKPLMSKLRMVGKMFEGCWVDLSARDQAALSIEGLYIAARMVKLGAWDKEQALHEAVSKPVGYLWQQHKVAYAGEFEWCQCTHCGDRHHKKLEPPLE